MAIFWWDRQTIFPEPTCRVLGRRAQSDETAFASGEATASRRRSVPRVKSPRACLDSSEHGAKLTAGGNDGLALVMVRLKHA